MHRQKVQKKKSHIGADVVNVGYSTVQWCGVVCVYMRVCVEQFRRTLASGQFKHFLVMILDPIQSFMLIQMLFTTSACESAGI